MANLIVYNDRLIISSGDRRRARDRKRKLPVTTSRTTRRCSLTRLSLPGTGWRERGEARRVL